MGISTPFAAVVVTSPKIPQQIMPTSRRTIAIKTSHAGIVATRI